VCLLKAKNTPALLFLQGKQYFHAGLTFREIQGASYIQDGIGHVTAKTHKVHVLRILIVLCDADIFNEHAYSCRSVDLDYRRITVPRSIA
jgi:hypothetical protein